MIKHVYIYRDKKLGVYQVPILEIYDQEQVTELTARTLKEGMVEGAAKSKVKDLALYYMGTFDDITGKLVILDEYQKLLDCEDYIPRGNSDGTKEN